MEPPQTVLALAASEPRLDEFVAEYSQGTPLRVLEIRIKCSLGKSLADQFVSAFRSPALIAGLPNELEGSLGQKHGLLGDCSWTAPQLATRADDLARPGYDTDLAHEYLDVDEVLRLKATLLAGLVRKAQRLVIYAGAGLSTASGVGDYATRTGDESVLGREMSSAGQSQIGFVLPEKALPNLGHAVVSAMTRAGMVWRIVQQNHDGLFQKAGVPQHFINEIHGSWFDPSNPVVKMTESLREDLYEDTCLVNREADLVIVLGSSLAGMNTDRIVHSCATRAMSGATPDACLGSVIVSLQRTPHDADSSLRVFSTTSKFLNMLASELSLQLPEDYRSLPNECSSDQKSYADDMFVIPYGIDGALLSYVNGAKRKLDLREGSELVVTIGSDRGQPAVVIGKHPEGHYKVRVKRSQDHGGVSSVRYLGVWWVSAAVGGKVPFIPMVSP